MWGASTSAGLFAVAFILGLMTMALAFGVGILAVPIAAIGVVIIGLFELSRRRRRSQTVHQLRRRAHPEDRVEFTDRDRETLVSE